MNEPRQPAAAIPCLICGYDLAGLDQTGVCPECAAPMAPSFRRNLFELTGLDHGRRIANGLRTARDAAWAGLISMAAGIVGTGTDTYWLTMLLLGLFVAVPLFCFGWWNATRLPRERRPQGLLRPARLAQSASIATAVLFFTLVVVAGPSPGTLVPMPLWQTLLVVLSLSLLVAVVATIILTGDWLGCLATHLGDDRTPRQVRRRIRLAPVLVVVWFLLMGGAALLGDFASPGSTTRSIAIGAAVTVMTAGLAAFAWLYIGLIHKTHRTVRAAVDAAAVQIETSAGQSP